MRDHSNKFKFIAIVLVFAFTFQTMSSINSHTYTTGVYNIQNHYELSCFSMDVIGPHMNFNCTY